MGRTRLAVLGLLGALCTAALAWPSASLASDTTTTSPTAFAVDDAQLRWGVNNESNNRAFAPGTINFFSAGEVPNPGQGGTTLHAADWKAVDGAVRIEKARPDGTYGAATWEGLGTTRDGTTIPGPTSGEFSDHQVVIDGGAGVVDPPAGTATIAWDGTFTVVYYSGMSFFTVTDPTLTVTPTTAQLTATLGGYGSDQADPSVWKPLPATPVVLADLPRTALELPAAGGISVTPAYAGVTYDAVADQPGQVRSGPHVGAFPKTFVDFLASGGSGAYWYSSGGATDAYKAALPLTVSYSAGAPVVVPVVDTDDDTGSSKNKNKNKKKQPTPPEPTPPPTPSPTPDPPVARPALPVDVSAPPPPAAPLPASQPVAAPAVPGLAAPLPAYALTSAADAAPIDSETHTMWLLGAVLLLGAVATTLFSALRKGTR